MKSLRYLSITIAVILSLSGCAGIRSAESDIAKLHQGEAVAAVVVTKAAPVIRHVQKRIAEAKRVGSEAKKDVATVENKIDSVVKIKTNWHKIHEAERDGFVVLFLLAILGLIIKRTIKRANKA